MSRLVVVSNRVAVPEDGEDGEGKPPAGGLAVALQEALQEAGGIWFGWSGEVKATTQSGPRLVARPPVTFALMDLSRKNYNEYYNGFANRALWPLFHYRLDLAAFSKQNYSGYLRVNRLFAESLAPLLEADDLLWVHDYHLIPIGQILRGMGTHRPMGFFLHTPFPAMEVLVAMPAHRELVQALCNYDVLGFQTANDLRAFLDYVIHEAGGQILGSHLVRAFDRVFRAEVIPIGIDTEGMIRAGLDAGRNRIVEQRRERLGDRTWIVGVDRLDYSKGLSERFQAFARMLRKHKRHRGQVTLLQIAPPSRSEVPEYMDIRHALEAEAGHINGEFADVDWVPINYINSSFSREDLAAFYRASRIGLVTPLRDGMNLVAKEYVAAQNMHDPGVLILSRFAGAARELDAAIIVNPFDFDGTADALHRALRMSLEERRERWSAMMKVLRGNTLSDWREHFLGVLRGAPYDT